MKRILCVLCFALFAASFGVRADGFIDTGGSVKASGGIFGSPGIFSAGGSTSFGGAAFSLTGVSQTFGSLNVSGFGSTYGASLAIGAGNMQANAAAQHGVNSGSSSSSWISSNATALVFNNGIANVSTTGSVGGTSFPISLPGK